MSTETITVLNTEQRRFLDTQTQRAREAAQRAAEDALRALAVSEPSRPAYLSEQQNKLRLALRDKARQLGDDTSRAGVPLTNLVHDVAYEQWHRLLFARFLEVNGLLRHPEYRDIPLSLEDCGDLASDLGEPDAWAVAARFASEILPGVFRLTDPAVQVGFAAEHRNTLERLLLEIPAEVFTTEDALGWVYQFWQTAEKKRVNDSGVKIGGADISPVTQLFTENYMVRFLLENSLGAWWVARHPESPLVDSWEYLRLNEDGTPAAGSFNEWPECAADVTVMDPCCGSGHFLVAMFGMLWRMRAEEEGLTSADAQDAVLRDNLHGLELDPRCTQIATFNIALEAWKQGGFRELPAPQIACSGIPVRGKREDWEALAGTDTELRGLLGRLHGRFREADTLGSLIDPRPSAEVDALIGRDMTINIGWDRTREALSAALAAESSTGTVVGYVAEDVLHAAVLLGAQYTLVATNPPYLLRGHQEEGLRSFLQAHYPRSQADLATAFYERLSRMATTIVLVLPQSWTSLLTYRDLRRAVLESQSFAIVGRLGAGAFSGISGEIVQVVLQVSTVGRPSADWEMQTIDVSSEPAPVEIALALKEKRPSRIQQSEQLRNRESRILFEALQSHAPLGNVVDIAIGLHVGDDARFRRQFWEVPEFGVWAPFQMASEVTGSVSGLDSVIWWPDDGRMHRENPNARVQGDRAWGKVGVAIRLVRPHPVAPYWGDLFGQNIAAMVPYRAEDLEAVWHFVQSEEFAAHVAAIDGSLKVTPRVFGSVPFDRERWGVLARNRGGLPEPSSVSDPGQWVFSGKPYASAQPLQVAVARLLGYAWPEQSPDALTPLADADGIAALVSLPGEPDLVTRLRELLTVEYGAQWTGSLERKLVAEAGGKNGRLEDWLRDSFFAQHVKVFDNRPFLWHIWDGRKDGFSAIVNYHKLDRRTLEKLTFASLGAWIDRQKHETRAERAGADARLAAAEDLQHKLELILEGAPPHDVYVRWKPIAEQPIGWEPDLDDGVRLNIRPFVTAGVLRSKVNVHWKKDRGTNPDGSERHNDLHPTLDERRAARRAAEATE